MKKTIYAQIIEYLDDNWNIDTTGDSWSKGQITVCVVGYKNLVIEESFAPFGVKIMSGYWEKAFKAIKEDKVSEFIDNFLEDTREKRIALRA